MPSTRRTRPALPWRRHLRRALGTERNELARSVDRARSRSLVLAALAVTLAALLGAASAWAHLGSAERRAAAAAPHLHRLDAVLLTPARPAAGIFGATADRYQATAAWTYPAGQHNTGTVGLTRPARTGSTTDIWVGDTGQPATAPPSTANLVSDAVCVGLFVLGCLLVLTTCGLGLRMTSLDRQADAAWQHAWAELEPVWTGRAFRKPSNDDSRRG
ncbi:Rv1733c family protein [Kitasatospora sp. NPDC001159]